MKTKNFCNAHGILDIDRIYIKDNSPRCVLCNNILNFKKEVETMEKSNRKQIIILQLPERKSKSFMFESEKSLEELIKSVKSMIK